MKTIFWIAGLLILLALLGEMKITFAPFSVSFPGWRAVLGWVFLSAALVMFAIHNYQRGAIAGREKTLNQLEEMINDKKNENDANNTL